MRLPALHWQILIALLLAVPAGLAGGGLFGVALVEVYDFVGRLFLNALKMLVVPLIVATMISSMANSGTQALGRLGLRTLVYYLTTTLIAVLIGLAIINTVQPGIVDGQPAKDMLGLSVETAAVMEKVSGHDSGDLVDIFARMIPTNVFASAAEGDMLGLIVFSLLFGVLVTRLSADLAGIQRRFWQGVADIMLMLTDWVMKFAPLGVFGLVAATLARAGLTAFAPLAGFFFTVLAGLALHLFVVLPLIVWLVAGVSPVRHLRAMTPALLTAFSTASSSATTPITMDCLEKNAGVSARTTGFVIPLGATVNMDGTALYECAAVLFIAQAYGVDLSFAQQFTVVVLALLTSVGVAGIPAASLVAITLILTSVGLPAEAIGLILAVDRVLDMARTSVNVFSDTCGAVVVARMLGERLYARDA